MVLHASCNIDPGFGPRWANRQVGSPVKREQPGTTDFPERQGNRSFCLTHLNKLLDPAMKEIWKILISLSLEKVQVCDHWGILGLSGHRISSDH